jgi:hypothetical protein
MKGLYKYTPALQSPETLKTTIVGREKELRTIERILGNASRGGSLSHLLIIGPKGIGKTHMLRTIYHALKGDIDVVGIERFRGSFIPVIFSEEEYVTGVIKFLRLAIEYLKKDRKDMEIPHGLTAKTQIDERQKEEILEFTRDFRKKTGSILLLLVDNFNDIIETFTEEDQSVLREILMVSESVLLIGTAPTLFQAILNHERPFYNFFETLWLHDITFDETKGLLARFAELEGRTDLLETIEKKKDKLRAIYELSGGNPRLIISLYHIMAEVDITSVEETFQRMLDEMSPYFSAKMKDLSPQQREIMDVIAQAEQLLTPTETAHRCGIPVNQVNAQIKRLEEMGYLQKVTGRKRKGVLYDVRERLFSLWRQMRVEAGRQRMSFIIRFLEIWFTKEEIHIYIDKTLQSIKECIRSAPERLSKEMDRLWYLKEASPEYRGIDEDIVMIEKDPQVAITVLKKKANKQPADPMVWWKLAYAFSLSGKREEEIKTLKRVVEIKPDKHEAWYNMGNSYYKLGRYEEAVEAYKKALEVKPDDHRYWSNMGTAYRYSGKYSLAIKAFEESIRLKQDETIPWRNLIDTYLRLFERDFRKSRKKAAGHLKKALECIPDAGSQKEVFEVFATVFKEIVQKGRVDVLRTALEEIDSSSYEVLKKGLSPFFVLVKYLEKKDKTLLERLKHEERLIVDEMLRTLDRKSGGLRIADGPQASSSP